MEALVEGELNINKENMGLISVIIVKVD